MATDDYHLYRHTHTPPDTPPSQSLTNGGMRCGSANAISHSVGVTINLAAGQRASVSHSWSPTVSSIHIL